MQASVTLNGDYLMFDNAHYLKTRAETVSALYSRCILVLYQQNNEKTCVAQASEELYLGKSLRTG